MGNHAFSRVDASSVDPRPFGQSAAPVDAWDKIRDLHDLGDELGSALQELHALPGVTAALKVQRAFHATKSLAGDVDDVDAEPDPLPTRSASDLADDLGAMAMGIDAGWRSAESLSLELLRFQRDVTAMKALAAAQGVSL